MGSARCQFAQVNMGSVRAIYPYIGGWKLISMFDQFIGQVELAVYLDNVGEHSECERFGRGAISLVNNTELNTPLGMKSESKKRASRSRSNDHHVDVRHF